MRQNLSRVSYISHENMGNHLQYRIIFGQAKFVRFGDGKHLRPNSISYLNLRKEQVISSHNLRVNVRSTVVCIFVTILIIVGQTILVLPEN